MAEVAARNPRSEARHDNADSGPPRIRPRVTVLAGLLAYAALPFASAGQAMPTTAELIRERIEVLRLTGSVSAEDRTLLAISALPLFYEDRAFEPAWTSSGGHERLEELLSAIRRSEVHGLDPDAYHASTLDSLARRAGEGRHTVDLELLASDAFLVLGSHLLQGRANPETVNPEWLANRRDERLDTVLAAAVEHGRIEQSLYELAPQQTRYRNMVGAARRLRRLVARGGWPTVPPGEPLEMGSEGSRVLALRARLEAEGSGALGASGERTLFDRSLRDAIRDFQQRHGLDRDGVVGPATLEALNVPAAERLRRININLERWRWLPADLGSRHIEVNIPGFETRVVEKGTVVSIHRSVVGRPFRATPSFTGAMSYLVLSPYWHVPPNIAAADKLPGIQRDPGTIAAEGMTLLEMGTDRPVDPSTVDWGSLTPAEFNRRYRLRQNPGPRNALGMVKFMFPNRHHVYLHDTPSRELFERTARSFSSGCIRVDRALDLAEYLLGDRPEWTRERIERVARGGTERTVTLTESVPVHLLYWTAWMEDDGLPHYRDDIYARDDVVWRALTAPPPVEGTRSSAVRPRVRSASPYLISRPPSRSSTTNRPLAGMRTSGRVSWSITASSSMISFRYSRYAMTA